MNGVRLLSVLGLLTAGCAALIGVPDLTFDEGAEQGAPDGSTPTGRVEGGAGDDAAGTDSGVPSTPCDQTKLDSDPRHCGRCGHDCLGGECLEGKCQPALVAAGLKNPVALAADATHVYVTTKGDGAVLAIPKAGGDATVLASGFTNAEGVAVSGSTLYWTSGDHPGDGGDGFWGGVWTCSLPACTDKRYVTPGAYALHVQLGPDGFLYFAENNASAVTRVRPDGSQRSELAGSNKPFSVAVDGAHVYFTSNSNFLRRAPFDGGPSETVGPLTTEQGATYGFVTVDATRVYWAYADADPNRGGHVRSESKATLAGPISYGSPSTNRGSLGVAVDGTHVYWTNEGVPTADGVFSNDGDLLRCAKDGCAPGEPEVVAKALLSPGPLIVDGDAIYFVEFGTSANAGNGTLRRVAKP